MKVFVLVTGVLFLGLLAVLAPVYLAEAAPLAKSAQEGQVIFQSKCSSCHTIGGGKLVGPDLEGVTARRDLDWLKSFILAPDRMISSGDPIATQLLAENNNIPMPNLLLKEAEVQSILAYLENPQAAGQGAPQPAAPLPPGAAQAGQLIFNGNKRLSAGGTGCIACHTVQGNGALGGGSLGPDLTNVVTRLGEPGLTSSLSNIVFPTMQGPFLNRPLTPQEQADLIAYLKWADQQPPLPAPMYQQIFLGAGALGTLILFGVMLVFWPKQRESLSARLRKSQGRRKE